MKKVLNFYKKMPFNIYDNAEVAIKNIKNFNLKETYPFLDETIKNSNKIIDIGCGGGWLVNVISYHYKKIVTGLDFNKIAINHAKKISKKLKNKNHFIINDIFKMNLDKKFDLIVSLGVLHHTKNAIQALDRICKLGKSNSVICVGLYHKYSRKPFIEKFKKIKNRSNNNLFEIYKQMHFLTDQTHQISWFRDQVLHPHETSHTLQEVIDIFKKNKYEFIGTSINRFKKEPISDILYKEKKLYKYALNKIKKNIYYPGFFITMGKKI